MDPRAIRSFVDRLLALATPAAGAQLRTASEKLVDDLVNAWGDVYTRAHVRNMVTNILRDANGPCAAGELDARFRQLVEDHRTFDAVYWLPVYVVGVALEVDPLTLGDAELRLLERSQVEAGLASRVVKGFDAEAAMLDLYPFWDGVHVVCEEKAMWPLAVERAASRASRSAELVQYAAILLRAHNPPIVGIQGEMVAQPHTQLGVDSGVQRLQMARHWPLAQAPFGINSSSITDMQVASVFWLADKADGAASARTQIHEALLRAVHWLAVGHRQRDAANQVLSYVIALEALWAQDSGTGISHTVAEGTALLLADDGPSRRATYSRIRDYYSIRSRTAHGERAGDITDDALRCLRRYVAESISALARRAREREEAGDPWKTVQDVHAWVAKQRFA
ncbi:hypothetical protein HN371_21695 [Candidatus Poribacteria bacterium]|jgi:hypothetical protein|nr:hypothetical protein [Candidatus Poribacteria bacterium]MBT5532474.1 hypothetical protein [Candidatus Poribacteria bacterium]MBT5713632.1 hypothetical protein [Candidatus Poribacteria bacterium]MBT7097337.1 hypothetical protein [Candidatus Poribacteria bacterium]